LEPIFYSSKRDVDPKIPPPEVLVVVLIGFLGMFVLPQVPIGFSFLVEVSYPVSEVMSIGLVSFFGQGFGIFVVDVV
jgi:hypothetical protein